MLVLNKWVVKVEFIHYCSLNSTGWYDIYHPPKYVIIHTWTKREPNTYYLKYLYLFFHYSFIYPFVLQDDDIVTETSLYVTLY